MPQHRSSPTGYLTLTLHAHLPWVINHGTWPHGLEWLHEAAAETCLPLLRVFANLERDGLALHPNLNISPVLLEQLAHPVFRAEFPVYLERKITFAREDEAYFRSTGEWRYAETACFWQRFFAEALEHFRVLHGDIVAGFRAFHERGVIDVITCGATHGYMPLLGTDESVRAQVRTAVATHRKHIGSEPRGIWLPECGYRPAGEWQFPVAPHDGSALPPSGDRAGVEEIIAESGLEFFFVDTHLIEESAAAHSPYAIRPQPASSPAQCEENEQDLSVQPRSLYRPYFAAGPASELHGHPAPTVFPRDPRTGLQVWSGEHGYPGDPEYLDFHKKRWPGGHRYWRVTGTQVDMHDKAPYDPAAAAERVQQHAEHFVRLVCDTLAGEADQSDPPILCSPFDAELFGHWWFEGPAWLEAVARRLGSGEGTVALTSCSAYLGVQQPKTSIAMHEGSWGAGGDNQVWLNPETAWTYAHLYPAELFCRAACSDPAWAATGVSRRVTRQLCRELLLLESSDWQFLITTGAARDYAELRFRTHLDQFNELRHFWQQLRSGNDLDCGQTSRLAAIEERDSLFADIDPACWAEGARATGPDAPDTGEQELPSGCDEALC